MDRSEQILLKAIQRSLWNTEVDLPSDTDWDEVLTESQKQTVLGIAIEAAPDDEKKKWKSRTSAGMAHFVRILHYQERLCKLLKANDIPAAILKGTAAAVYYPDPYKRTMGDIDFIVPPERFDKTLELLLDNGYAVDEEEDNRRHVHLHADGVFFELHRFYSLDDFDIDPYIFAALDRLQTASVSETEFSMLPRLENGLVLLTHVLQHFRTGIGLRQIIDWMMYADRELDGLYWEQTFKPVLEKQGLTSFAVHLTRMCQLYLGLTESISWCGDADEKICGELMDEVMLSGNFGKKNSQGKRFEDIFTNFRREGTFRYLQRAGEYNWAAYHKHKWLKPFAWMYQIGRYTGQVLKSRRKAGEIREDYENGRRRSLLVKKLEIGKEQDRPTK